MNRRALRLLLASALALAVLGAACGTDDDGPLAEPRDGPTITVASFDFSESVILAEIYAQVLEAEGFPVERKLSLGARELIFPSIERGEIDLLPEYVGSSLSVGFGLEPSTDPQEAYDQLVEAFAERAVTVLEPAPGEDKNVYVVTGEYAEEHGLEAISDLGDVPGTIAFGGPPECQDRDTCLVGLTEVYGLTNLDFRPIGEFGARVAALSAGEVQLVALFSTQPVIAQEGWVALEDDQRITPPENIVPVVRDEIVEAYGDDLVGILDRVTARITTEVLLELNGRVELDLEDPDDVAGEWLRQQGFI